MINIDPRIKVKIIPDGEIHIRFAWSMDDLEQFSRAWLAMSEGKLKDGDVAAVFRIRNKDAVDYWIEELKKARKELWG